MVLEEYDVNKNAVINPDMVYHKVKNFPETVVSVFSYTLFDKLAEVTDAKPIAKLHDSDGEWIIYKFNYKGVSLALAKARIGAPACVGVFEDVIALGGKRIILTGNCGVLDPSIKDCGIIIPRRAIRDEGTSYHYAPPGDYVDVNGKYVDDFKEICRESGYGYVEGTTWTTDAFYRETPDKVAKRREMGAICVEMECAAMQAMADFRGVDFFQFLYAGDKLDCFGWDPRSLSNFARLDDKEKIAVLALELAYKIESNLYGTQRK